MENLPIEMIEEIAKYDYGTYVTLGQVIKELPTIGITMKKEVESLLRVYDIYINLRNHRYELILWEIFSVDDPEDMEKVAWLLENKILLHSLDYIIEKDLVDLTNSVVINWRTFDEVLKTLLFKQKVILIVDNTDPPISYIKKLFVLTEVGKGSPLSLYDLVLYDDHYSGVDDETEFELFKLKKVTSSYIILTK